MSSDRTRNISDMFTATLAFDAINRNDYKVLQTAIDQFAIVQTAANALQTYFSDQMAGAGSQAVEQKSVLKAAIRRKMKEMSKTARALNIDDPGFRKLFSVPSGMNEAVLIATAIEFVEQFNLHKAAFVGLGTPETLGDQLQTDVNALETAITAKDTAMADKAGTGAGIDDQIDKGMDAEIILDAIMHNVYRDDPVKLAAWRTARHVKRAPHKKPTPPSP